MNRIRLEPVAVAGAVRMILLAAVALGLDLSPGQIVAVVGAVEAVLVALVRGAVTPTAKAQS